MDYLYLLAWWLGMFYLGGVTFILFRPYMQTLTDQGYAVTKAIGLVLFSFILWILASSQLMSYSSLAAYLVAGVLGLIALRQVLAGNLGHIPWRAIAAQEAIFAGSLLVWGIVRSYNPRIEGVEKFMDIAVLQSLLRTDYFPAADPWFANEPFNYYYFGHLLVSSVAKLIPTPGEIAFNLGLVLIFALCVTIITSLVYSLSRSKIAAGVAAFLLTLSSNLDPAINTILKTKDYIFFSATRLDPYTINEFPLYSFTVADLHAHTLGLPIALSIICLLYIVLKSDKIGWPIEILLALLIGAAGPTNSFDLVIYGALTGLTFMYRAYLHHGLEWTKIATAALRAIGIGALAGLLYIPFYLSFQPPVGGVGIALFQTPLTFILVNFGVMLFIALPIIAARIPEINVKEQLAKRSQEDNFIWLLLIFSFLLVLATEFIYLKDIYTYQNPPYARANTIFKVYYQAWVLLAIVAAYGLAKIQHLRLKWQLGEVYIIGVGVFLALSLVGTWSGIQAYADSKPDVEPSWTLNGYAYLDTYNPDQRALIDWMNQNIDDQPTILEAAGESYTRDSIVSSYTGLPAVLGWASHEWGWRYSNDAWETVISPRLGEVSQFYAFNSKSQMQSLIRKYDIQYIVVSPIERDKYQIDSTQSLQDVVGPPIFEQGEYALFKVSPE